MKLTIQPSDIPTVTDPLFESDELSLVLVIWHLNDPVPDLWQSGAWPSIHKFYEELNEIRGSTRHGNCRTSSRSRPAVSAMASTGA